MTAASVSALRFPVPAVSRRALAIGAIVALAIVGRFMSGWITPLGFDETFSAVIASQHDTAALIDWCLNEIGGPVYYMLLWGWAQVFGTGVAALRSFSFVASLAAPLAILRWGHPDREVRVLWAALLALWLPALEPATNARCYALLMLATTGQAIAFRRLLMRTDPAQAMLWTGMSALAVLTHYHAAILSGIQGLILLALRPRRTLRCWPAVLPLLPMAGWMTVHLTLLARFATQGAWYKTLDWSELLVAPEIFFGSAVIGYGAIVGLVLAWRRPHDGLRDLAAPDVAVASSGAIALVLILLLGMIQPSFSWRYVFMLGPPILLGIAAAVRQASRVVPTLPALVLLVFAASVGGRIAAQASDPQDSMRYILNLGRPSEWLVAHHAAHTGFIWDSPTGRMSDPARLAQVVAFGPRELGHPVAVTVLPQPDGMPRARVIEEAAAARRIDSVIWLADAAVPGTRARPKAAVLRRHGWRCRDFGGHRIVMLTCAAGDRTAVRNAPRQPASASSAFAFAPVQSSSPGTRQISLPSAP
jgi:hypothetical protein